MIATLLVMQLFALGWLYLIDRRVGEIQSELRQLRGIDARTESDSTRRAARRS
jgi:hypothetical protein